MLARPFASDTVIARDTCRLKCSVVANVAACLRLWRPRVRPAGTGWARCRDRWRSRRVPVGMAKRLAGVLARHREDQHTRGPAIGDDDVGLARIAVPFERDGEVAVASCVELDKHARLLWTLPSRRAAGLDGTSVRRF